MRVTPISTWSLKKRTTTRSLPSATLSGVLTFKSPPDFDSPGDGGADNVYNVTVKLAAKLDWLGDGERAVEVTVTDAVDEPGTVKFWTLGNQQPQVGGFTPNSSDG